MLFDSHAHLDDSRFDQDRNLVIEQARQNGVSTILNAGACMATSAAAIKLSEQYDLIYAAVGVHPQDAKEITDEQPYRQMAEWARLAKVVAIGEIGLDYHYDFSPREMQKKVLIRQLDLARQLSKPVIIHDREAHKDIMAIMKTEARGLMGVFHCFSGSTEMMQEVIGLGLYISIGGSITFSNSVKLKEVAKAVPLERLLIETDCPYLTPQKYRGKRNEPTYVRYVAEEIAVIKGMDWQAIAQATADNAKRLFCI